MNPGRYESRKMYLGRQLLLAVAFLTSSACGNRAPAPNTFTVFAAASLTPIVEELVRTQDLDRTARLHTAATSTLARQLESGAEADLILTAHPEWIAWLVERDLIEPGSVRDIASNELVWIVSNESADTTSFLISPQFGTDANSRDAGTDSKASLNASAPPDSAPDSAPNSNLNSNLNSAFNLPPNARLAVGDPAHVPLGRYTREALIALNLWSDLRPQSLPTLDARSALRLVELRQAEAGIVYASDATSSARVTIRARFPRDLHAPIRYQAAALRGASPAARAFLDTLSSPAVTPLFRTFGFLPPAP